MKKQYTLETVENLCPLSSIKVGYYNELLILNYTSFDVIVIDHTGQVNTIPGCPVYTGNAKEVIIEKRMTVGNTLKNVYGAPETTPGVKITIAENELAIGPVYVSELNLVIASAMSSKSVKHPYGCMDYQQAALTAKHKFEKAAKNSVIVSITANDPTHTLNELFIGVGHEMVRIPVQNEIDVCDTPTLVYAIRYPDSRVDVLTVELDEFTDKDKVTYLENSLVGFVATTEAEAQNAISNYKVYSEETFKIKLDQLKNIYDNKLNDMKNDFETDKLVMAGQIKRLKEDLSEREHEYKILLAKYESIAGMMQQADIQLERQHKTEIMKNTKEISNNNVEISETKSITTRRESDYKLWHIVAAAVVPVIAACAGMAIKKWADS